MTTRLDLMFQDALGKAGVLKERGTFQILKVGCNVCGNCSYAEYGGSIYYLSWSIFDTGEKVEEYGYLLYRGSRNGLGFEHEEDAMCTGVCRLSKN